MVDCKSYTKLVPQAWCEVIVQPDPTLVLKDVPEDELHLCAPTVCGYSFTAKKWGRFVADQLKPIQWEKEAFGHLVLSEEKKSLVQSIVFANRSAIVSDVISAKAGGFVVILHGEPGTGKTLTAEAAAETAEKPLMVLSAGELGGRPAEVEINLQNILEVCKVWDAILLINEAEVYLEARSLGDIERNGMVSAFLRVLEYHQQVIFLTTNHIDRLDIAFKSRVSVAIKYPNLDHEARREIWKRFLKLSGVSICGSKKDGETAITKRDLLQLAEMNVNGRYTLRV
jgi:SpoVK/Ycf46/Vps4 family AAA+-type ATPase